MYLLLDLLKTTKESVLSGCTLSSGRGRMLQWERWVEGRVPGSAGAHSYKGIADVMGMSPLFQELPAQERYRGRGPRRTAAGGSESYSAWASK